MGSQVDFVSSYEPKENDHLVRDSAAIFAINSEVGDMPNKTPSTERQIYFD